MANTADVPGPGQYDPKLAGGGSAFSFGGARVAEGVSTTPGPEYNLPGAFGVQEASTKATVPAFSIGSASARGAQAGGDADGKYYDVEGAFGTQGKSGKVSVASYSMGMAGARSEGEARPGTGEPGPGSHEHGGAFGAQGDSTKPSGSAFSIGRARRGGDGAAAGNSPGPGAYSDMDGRSLNTIKPSAPNFSMGGAPSRPASAGAALGGRYYNVPGAFGRQDASTKSAPPAQGSIPLPATNPLCCSPAALSAPPRALAHSRTGSAPSSSC